jgi:hypothetical protein
MSAYCQTGSYPPLRLPVPALKSDFQQLRDTLQKIHPSLYRFKSKTEIDHIFDSCYSALRDSMPVTEFYTLTSYVIAAIGDGHANCRLPREIVTDYMGAMKTFPAMLLFIHNRAFIFCCKQKDSLAGTELLSINGRSMDGITQRLFQYIPTDGNIQSKKNWEMPEFFHLLYTIVYGQENSFDITYQTKEGAIRQATLTPDYLKNCICASPFPRPDKYLQLSYTANNIAVLTIKTFFDDFLKPTGENFPRFLDSAFNDIKTRKVKRLIIDGRRNQGGYDQNGRLLYAYLTKKRFAYYASRERIKGPIPEGQDHELSLQLPKENSYTGKVYFLMDGRSFSGTAEFAAIAKSNRRGLFIGEETGGTYCGNTSGSEAMVTLPNTRISCRIPLIKYTMAVKKTSHPDRGVIPDYPVYPTISDIIGRRDSQLDFAIKLASK